MAKTEKTESEKQFKWAYVYMDTCGPCQRVTPIIDTAIGIQKALGVDNIQKVQHADATDELKRLGTPALIRVNSHLKPVGRNYNAAVFQAWEQIQRAFPSLLTTNKTWQEFLGELLSQTEKDLNP